MSDVPIVKAAICLVFVALIPTAVVLGEDRFDNGFDPSMGVSFTVPEAHGMNQAFSPDGCLRAETEYQVISVFNTEDDSLVTRLTTAGGTRCPTFTQDGSRLIAAVCRGNLGCISTLYSWDLKTSKSTPVGECSGSVTDIAIDSSGKKLVATTSYGSIFSMVLAQRANNQWYGGEIAIFDQELGSTPIRIFCELQGIELPNREEIEKSGNKKSTARWREQLVKATLTAVPVQVGFTPDGSYVIAVTQSGIVRAFDAKTGKSESILSRRGRSKPETEPKSDQHSTSSTSSQP